MLSGSFNLEKTAINPYEKLQQILGEDVLEEFKAVFEAHDEEGEGELSEEQAILAFEDLGGQVTKRELRLWTSGKGRNGRTLKVFDLVDFVIAYANLFFPSDIPKERESEILARSLRLNDSWKDLTGFARNFGKKQLLTLERAFDSMAVKNEDNTSVIKAGDLLEVLHRAGKAITVSRLQLWMTESDVRPHDTLTLADFVSVFAFFFSSSAVEGKGASVERLVTSIDFETKRSLSDVAILVMQEERWRGTKQQMMEFMKRLFVGRS